jgi:hypothetical protein
MTYGGPVLKVGTGTIRTRIRVEKGHRAHLPVALLSFQLDRQLPASAGEADGADEEPGLRTADGTRRGVQQQRLHKVSYFRELLSANGEVPPSLRPLLYLAYKAGLDRRTGETAEHLISFHARSSAATVTH